MTGFGGLTAFLSLGAKPDPQGAKTGELEHQRHAFWLTGVNNKVSLLVVRYGFNEIL